MQCSLGIELVVSYCVRWINLSFENSQKRNCRSCLQLFTEILLHMYLSSELFCFRCSQSSHFSSLICNRLLVLSLKGTRRWRGREKTDVLWHTRIYWPCISTTHTLPHIHPTDAVYKLHNYNTAQQNPKPVNVKSYLNWVRLSLFKMIEAWKDAAIKEITSWITVIKLNTPSICWKMVQVHLYCSVALILLDRESDFVMAFTQLKACWIFLVPKHFGSNKAGEYKYWACNHLKWVISLFWIGIFLLQLTEGMDFLCLKISESARWHQCSCLVYCC